MRGSFFFLFVLLTLLALAPSAAQAQTSVPVIVTPELLETGEPLRGGWRFHAGDDFAWADPDFDDSAWRTIDPQMRDRPPDDWSGIGWFRLRIQRGEHGDDRLDGENLVIVLRQWGASELYFDGDLVAQRGVVAARPEDEQVSWFDSRPLALDLRPGQIHVLAVRYSNQNRQELFGQGFEMTIHTLEDAQIRRDRFFLSESREGAFLSGVGVVLAILHCTLFLFSSGRREHLAYAVFCGLVGGIFWTDNHALLSLYSPESLAHWFRWTLSCALLLPLAGILFAVYAFRDGRLPIHDAVIILFSLGLTAFNWIAPWPSPVMTLYCSFLGYLEIVRLLIVAIWQRRQDAWIIGIGSIVLLVCYWATISEVFRSAHQGRLLISFGILSFLGTISLYLSRGLARAFRENQRQNAELEAARELQFSLLPSTAPDLSWLQTAFRMSTATAVGGDFYDYRVHPDGRLTFAIGDATGHGLDSGLVVAAVKSMFQSLDRDEGLTEGLAKLSRGVQRLGLRRHNMAFQLIRLDGAEAEVASAGMPPPLIYRAAREEIEEIETYGPPLGTRLPGRYKLARFSLQPGDTVLLMSDGLPEIADSSGEPLGYERVARVFQDAASRHHPEQIVERLEGLADYYAGDQPLEDDRTLVVFRVRPTA